MLYQEDTIAAIATPTGEGGISIVRVSGPDARSIFELCFRKMRGAETASHRLYYGYILAPDQSVLDEAMGVFMKGPKTYTREDVFELHCHGGLWITQSVLNCVLEAGARLSEPGEFTKRAFLNGRIDLSRAEAVMQMIGAGSALSARSAMRQMEGGVSRFVLGVKEQLTDLLALIEAGNDFPDEIEEQATAEQVLEGIRQVRLSLVQSSDENAARIVREGLSVVLIGKPNVGKSSLMNALLRQERAIVTNVPGTTRDVLTERLRLGSLLIELSDTAGQREAQDEAERIGVERAQRAELSADVVLLVLDASHELDEEDASLLNRMDERTILVLNKTDLTFGASNAWGNVLPKGVKAIRVCALNGEGIKELLEELTERSKVSDQAEHQMVLARHIECAKKAIKSLEQAADTIENGLPIDLASIDLMQALESMLSITGESVTENVIERIFERFCVGK